jgi:hypothetical protein
MGLKSLSIVIPAVILAGCSSFERDWRAAAAAPSPADPLAGAWKGEWRSQANGHGGGLRSLVTPLPEGRYQARYKATYGCCFTFEYSVPMTVVRDGDTNRFHGSASLGFLAGGEYHYGGEASRGRFTCTYRSNSDHGIFEMEKVSPPVAPAAR